MLHKHFIENLTNAQIAKANMKIMSDTSVKLCPCKPKSNCPEVSLIEDGWIQIKDDFGGVVRLTIEEATEIKEALNFLNTNANN